MTEIGPAQPDDAEDMAEVQNAIHRAGLRASPVDRALVRERYLDEEHRVACTVAEQDGRLFATTLAAARDAGLEHIDASIGTDNGPALAYYAAMGFTPCRESGDVSPHRLDL